MRLAFVTICYMWWHLGPLYTMSQGQCWTQIQHSYWCSWNQPQGLYTRCQGWDRKKTFRSAPSTNKCWTLWPCIGPKAERRIPSNLGGQFATPGVNVLVNSQPKNAQRWHQVFLALPPSVKWALCNPCSFHCYLCLQLFFNHKLHFQFYFFILVPLPSPILLCE